MKIRLPPALVPLALSVLLAALPFLVSPASAAGQWMAASPELLMVQSSTPTFEVEGESMPPSLGSPRTSLTGNPPGGSIFSSGPYNVAPMIKEDDWKKRIFPYALVGAVVGGVIGYAADRGTPPLVEDCLAPPPGCWIVSYPYTIIGAGVGFYTGTLIGYLRERP